MENNAGNFPIKPIKNLIICNPYKEPTAHWKYKRDRREFVLVPNRRSAGFLVATQNSKVFDDPGEFIEIAMVNTIRKRVKQWKENGYPNITGITRKLLDHWNTRQPDQKRFFYCQLEAIETLIWIIEGDTSDKVGINIPTDGGDFERLCTKMATGTGKTVVMAMLIAWQVLNKISYPKDARFSKNVLIITPGLTVKKRLDVLLPEDLNNYYSMFDIVPESLFRLLYDAKIIKWNWHALKPQEDEKFSVVKKGTESGFALARRILGNNVNNIIVVNDEAHHAWRKISKGVQVDTEYIETATRWIEGLDKIHNTRKILKCYDFSATPFVPTSKGISEDTLFRWIVSDFSLNDAIESGLTKTPTVVVRDDSGKLDENFKSKFYHMYANPEIKSDLNRKAPENERLPNLVINAYMLLSQDWLVTKKLWDKEYKKYNSKNVPPVMVSICNSTHTAARVNYAFKKKKIGVDELSDIGCLLHIDTAALRKAEGEQNELNTSDAEILRQIINNVGKINTNGENIRNVISVQMITEGWDAHNVTHIMGLRAFSSQLLCEQTVGRGLRRMSYEIDVNTNLLKPEYVNIFGVPFTFLPHEASNPKPPGTIVPTTIIEPDNEKIEHMLSWPNVERINLSYSTILTIDWEKIPTLKIRSDDVTTSVRLAQVLEGKPDIKTWTDIDLMRLNKKIRMQTIIFIASKEVYESIHKSWAGNKEFLFTQLVHLTEKFISMNKIRVVDVPKENELRTKMSILFNMTSVVRHVCEGINGKNVEQKHIVLNQREPMKSTALMRRWETVKPVERVTKNHINFAVYDKNSKWESVAGNELERNKNVISWTKNDHIGFIIKYTYDGKTPDYLPDFIIKLKNNIMLVLEIKGQDNEKNRAKRKYLKEWVEAINDNGNYGTWACDVAFHPTDVKAIIAKHSNSHTSSKTTANCPSCGICANGRIHIEKYFGFRTVDGIIRPQSWCRKCRSKSKR